LKDDDSKTNPLWANKFDKYKERSKGIKPATVVSVVTPSSKLNPVMKTTGAEIDRTVASNGNELPPVPVAKKSESKVNVGGFQPSSAKSDIFTQSVVQKAVLSVVGPSSKTSSVVTTTSAGIDKTVASNGSELLPPVSVAKKSGSEVKVGGVQPPSTKSDTCPQSMVQKAVVAVSQRVALADMAIPSRSALPSSGGSTEVTNTTHSDDYHVPNRPAPVDPTERNKHGDKVGNNGARKLVVT